MTDGLTLADLLGRDLSIEWHEAVAVVRGATARLLANPGQPNVLPALHQIWISPDGRIDLAGGTRATDPVRRLGQLLQATIGQTAVPLQLRHIISQATAVSPGFASIGAYDEALAYFERPDRATVLRALYERATAAAPVATATPLTLDGMAPLAKQEHSRKAKVQKEKGAAATPRRRNQLIAGAAGVLIFVGAVGVRYKDPASRRGMSAIVSRAADRVVGVLGSGLSAATETLGLGRLVSQEELAAAKASPPVPEPTPKADQTARKRPAATDAPSGSFTAFDLEAAPPAADRAPVPSEPSTAQPEDASTIYSRESAGVSPPVSVHPALTRELPANVNQHDLGAIELLISADGKVDSVRVVDQRLNIQDSAWLKAVKAWQFQPAFKDGLPVKYRKTVWIASNRGRESDARH